MAKLISWLLGDCSEYVDMTPDRLRHAEEVKQAFANPDLAIPISKRIVSTPESRAQFWAEIDRRKQLQRKPGLWRVK